MKRDPAVRTGEHTVDGSEISQTHQLWLAIYGILLIIYKVFAPSQVVAWDSFHQQCVASEVKEKFHQISLRHSFWLACFKGWGGDPWLVNEICVIGGYRHEFSVEFGIFDSHNSLFGGLHELFAWGAAAQAPKEYRIYDQMRLLISLNDQIR